VNEGPTGPPPDETPAPQEAPAETPAAETPAAVHEPAAWEVQQPAPAASEPAAEPAAPSPYAPPPDYPGAPGYPAPMAAAPRRSNRGIITAAAVILVVVLALVAYAGAGYAFAHSRIDSATSTYNTAVTHQNALTDEFNSFDSSLATSNLTTSTTASLKSTQALYAQLVTKSQAAQPTITADDAALAGAQASLSDNSWLTVFSRSDLDHDSAKIGHERNALAAAKTITGDFVQLGQFYQALLQTIIDLDDVGTKAQASDFSGTLTAIGTMKTDAAKAQQLASAPGVPADLKQFLTDMQTLAADLTKLFNDVLSGDTNAVNGDAKTATADGAKLDSYNWAKIASEVKAFYQPLIDKFNSEVSAANSM